MSIDGVLSRKKVFRLLNADLDVDPIFGRAVFELVDAIGHQPFVHKVQCLVFGLDESIHFVMAEMLAVARVVGIGD
jgi:hypothetical protein